MFNYVKHYKFFQKFLENEFVLYKGTRLPPPSIKTGGKSFSINKDFYNSALNEADRLIKHLNLNEKSRILDVGCGAGRLAIGLTIKFPKVSEYYGIDVDEERINWCKKNIGERYSNFKFLRINVFNERYNPKGTIKQSEYTFPFKNKFDIIYLYSVFSHLLEDDIRTYLLEFSRLLNKNGNLFLTGFIEEGVPHISINPKNYGPNQNTPLHCVRYDKNYFEEIFQIYNFRVEKFEYGAETDGQSSYYLSKK